MKKSIKNKAIAILACLFAIALSCTFLGGNVSFAKADEATLSDTAKEFVQIMSDEAFADPDSADTSALATANAEKILNARNLYTSPKFTDADKADESVKVAKAKYDKIFAAVFSRVYPLYTYHSSTLFNRINKIFGETGIWYSQKAEYDTFMAQYNQTSADASNNLDSYEKTWFDTKTETATGEVPVNFKLANDAFVAIKTKATAAKNAIDKILYLKAGTMVEGATDGVVAVASAASINAATAALDAIYAGNKGTTNYKWVEAEINALYTAAYEDEEGNTVPASGLISNLADYDNALAALNALKAKAKEIEDRIWALSANVDNDGSYKKYESEINALNADYEALYAEDATNNDLRALFTNKLNGETVDTKAEMDNLKNGLKAVNDALTEIEGDIVTLLGKEDEKNKFYGLKSDIKAISDKITTLNGKDTFVAGKYGEETIENELHPDYLELVSNSDKFFAAKKDNRLKDVAIDELKQRLNEFVKNHEDLLNKETGFPVAATMYENFVPLQKSTFNTWACNFGEEDGLEMQVTNYQSLYNYFEALAYKLEQEAMGYENEISAVVFEFTTEVYEKLNDIKKRLEARRDDGTDDGKTVYNRVTNKDTLYDNISMWNDEFAKANTWKEKVEQIPEVITYEDFAVVNAAVEEWNKLNTSLQAIIAIKDGDLYNTYVAYQKALNAKATIEGLIKAAKDAMDILVIGDNPTPSEVMTFNENVQTATDAYIKLIAGEKVFDLPGDAGLVAKYDATSAKLLFTNEDGINHAQWVRYQNALELNKVYAVEALIEGLFTAEKNSLEDARAAIQLKDKAAIEKARETYDGLNENYRVKVREYYVTKLQNAEQALREIGEALDQWRLVVAKILDESVTLDTIKTVLESDISTRINFNVTNILAAYDKYEKEVEGVMVGVVYVDGVIDENRVNYVADAKTVLDEIKARHAEVINEIADSMLSIIRKDATDGIAADDLARVEAINNMYIQLDETQLESEEATGAEFATNYEYENIKALYEAFKEVYNKSNFATYFENAVNELYADAFPATGDNETAKPYLTVEGLVMVRTLQSLYAQMSDSYKKVIPVAVVKRLNEVAAEYTKEGVVLDSYDAVRKDIDDMLDDSIEGSYAYNVKQLIDALNKALDVNEEGSYAKNVQDQINKINELLEVTTDTNVIKQLKESLSKLTAALDENNADSQISQIKTALENSIKSLSDALDTKEAALRQAYTDADTRLETALKNAIAEADATLEGKIKTAYLAAIADAKTELEGKLNDQKTAYETLINNAKTALEAKDTELETKINNLTSELNSTKSALEAKDKELEDMIKKVEKDLTEKYDGEVKSLKDTITVISVIFGILIAACAACVVVLFVKKK